MQPAEFSRAPSGSFTFGFKRSTVLCLLLVLLTLGFYNPIVRNGFTNFDDDVYILNNPHVRAGLTWDTARWAFTTFDAGNWHPLTWLSHALDCQLFRLNPAGHHYINVLLHAMNAVLLFLLLAGATGFTWPSFMVGAWFALHPVNVESVAWAAERKNVLSMFFFLLALHAYGRYVRRASVRRYAVVATLFALGLMAKPEIITLPFVLLLWDWWPLRRMSSGSSPGIVAGGILDGAVPPAAPVAKSFSFLLVEKVPLLLLAAGSGVITVLAQHSGHAVRTLQEYSARARFGNVLVAYVRYLGKAFCPVRLAPLYPHPGNSLPGWEVLASAVLLLALTALALRWRKRRYLAMGWFWFLGTLVPVIGMVQVGEQAMADRYAYIAYVGLFICVAWGAADLAKMAARAMERTGRMSPGPAWLLVPAVIVLLTLGTLSRRQIAYWHDSESLWRYTLSVTSGNYMAHDNLARALAEQGRTEEAMAEFNEAEKLHSYSAAEMLSLGIYEQTRGYVKDALEQYARSLKAAPDSNSRAVVLGWLGLAFTQMGDIPRAQMSYSDALKENPDNRSALIGSGLLAERGGDFGLAVTQISHSVSIQPSDVDYLLLAQALRRAGRLAEADAASAQAQRISNDFAQAQQSAAQLLVSAGLQP
jgi:tetratricopeptide (TPR) repeat protein